MCKRKLNFIAPGNFNDSLQEEIEKLRAEALKFCQQYGKIQYGSDYVIAAQPLLSASEKSALPPAFSVLFDTFGRLSAVRRLFENMYFFDIKLFVPKKK